MRSAKLFRGLIGTAIGAFFLWLVFRRTDWGAVVASIRGVKIEWLILSQVVLWASFFSRVQRWSYIVRAGSPASFRSMFSATQIGFLVNFTLPGRIGEVIRAAVLSRLARTPFPKCFAMAVLDRVTDVIGLIAVLLVSATAFRPVHDIILPADIYPRPIPADLVRTATVGATGLLLSVVAVLVLLYVNQSLVLTASDKLLGFASKWVAQRAHALLEQFAEGLHVFCSVADMLKALLLSLATWGLLVASSAFTLGAFGFHWPWYTPFLVLAFGAAITVLPAAPGFVGQVHFAIVVALLLAVPALDKADAQAVAIVMHLLNLLPIAVLGVFCLVREDLRITKLARASDTEVAQEVGNQAKL